MAHEYGLVSSENNKFESIWWSEVGNELRAGFYLVSEYDTEYDTNRILSGE